MLRFIVSAPYDTRRNDGISLYIRRVTAQLARLSPVTVLTPYVDTISKDCRVVSTPQWSTSRTGGLVWTSCILPLHRFEGDVLLSMTPVAPPTSRIPIISIVYDLTPLLLSEGYSVGTRLALSTSLKTLRRATNVVAISNNTKRDLIRWRVVPRDRIEVVYAGPGVEPLPTASDYGSEYSPFVLYVGGYGPNKNTDRLLDAFARLQIESRTKLVMVGWRTPSLLAQAVSAVRRHALTDRVVLLSNELTDTHLSALYQRCLMFVYPSLYEGFGLPVLEALAHGAPVVCSSSSSLPEIVGDSALCFDPRSTEDMARQMQRLADSPRLRAELGRRGKTRADGFSWKLVAQGVHAIARSTLQKGRG